MNQGTSTTTYVLHDSASMYGLMSDPKISLQ